MAHHAYFVIGDSEEGVSKSHQFISDELGLSLLANPDILTLKHGLLSVDDARKLRSLADLSPTKGDTKVLIITASRIFHEAQNALLKLFEEPPTGTVLILTIPAEGMLLPTLRSRLLPLPLPKQNSDLVMKELSTEVKDFLKMSSTEREKFLTKIVDRSKSDKDDEKQAARLQSIQLLEGLEKTTYAAWQQSPKKNLQDFLSDLHAFIPILHERSAPLKLIFEHIQLTMPSSL